MAGIIAPADVIQLIHGALAAENHHILTRICAISSLLLLLSATRVSADAPQQYTLRENFAAGQTFHTRIDVSGDENDALTKSGSTWHRAFHYRQYTIVDVKVLSVQDGMPIDLRLDVDPDSHDTQTDASGMKIIDNCYAGDSLTLHRNPDGKFKQNFRGKTNVSDESQVFKLMHVEDVILPDHPVAVGDMWEPKFVEFFKLPPHVQMMAQCQLGSVSQDDGKPVATIDLSLAGLREGRAELEQDIEVSGVFRVDINSGRVISWSETTTGTNSNPPGMPVEISGGWTARDSMVSIPAAPPATQP